MNTIKPLGVFLASASESECTALRMVAERQEGVKVVGGAANCADTLRSVAATKSDLLLIDWELPGSRNQINGSPKAQPGASVQRLIAALRKAGSPIHILVLTLDPASVPEALSAGADDVVCKDGPPQHSLSAFVQAIDALRAVAPPEVLPGEVPCP